MTDFRSGKLCFFFLGFLGFQISRCCRCWMNSHSQTLPISQCTQGLNTSKSRLAIDREFMYIGSAGSRRRADGRTAGAQPRPGGRAGGKDNLNDSITIFIDFHKKQKTMCFSVVSHPTDAQVLIFTAQMKKASKQCQKTQYFLTFQIVRERKYRFLCLK